MIEFKNVTKSYGDKAGLSDVNLSIDDLSLIHILTIYYLLQPYNAGTEIKSATYRIVTIVTYFICFFMMQIRMSTMIFGGMTILFCVLYCIAASVLVYKFAPKTFKLRV